MRLLIAAVAAAMLTIPAYAAETKVALTGDNTKITFAGTKNGGKKAGEKHEGGFKKLTGTATLADGEVSKIEVVIDTDSLYSDNGMLTGHLKSPDFFGVKTYPKAKFVTTKIEKSDKGHSITGDLTLHGKTNSLTFPATVTVKEGAVKVTGELSINQTDYGMVWAKGKLDDAVTIKVDLDAK
jgi:polyisoprenoid-binding protein YceI